MSSERELFLQIIAPQEASQKPADASERLAVACSIEDFKTRLEAIWGELRACFETTHALDFLFSPHMLLNNERPIDLLLSRRDAFQQIRMIIGQMRNSSAI